MRRLMATTSDGQLSSDFSLSIDSAHSRMNARDEILNNADRDRRAGRLTIAADER